MTNVDAAAQLLKDLKLIKAKGKLDVLAAVAGIPKARMQALAAGAVPTTQEISLINMLK